MDHPKERKHRATGNPRGGTRKGAGRPKGSPNALSLGEVQAIKACNLRVPEAAPEPIKGLANRALERLIEVMEEQVHPWDSRSVLTAATRIREEACGPLAQKLEHTGKDGEALQVVIQKYGADDED